MYKPLHYSNQSTSIIIKQKKKKQTNFELMTAALYIMTWNVMRCSKTVDFATSLRKYQPHNATFRQTYVIGKYQLTELSLH